MAMQEHPHEELIRNLAEQYRPVLDESTQAVFIYMDDYHKVCNRHFSDMLGYKSPDEWAMMKTPVEDTTEDTRNNLITAVMSAVQNKVASSVQVSWKSREGGVVDTMGIIAPGSFKGQTYVAHFFEPLR